MKISVVTTLYRSAPFLPEFYRRMKETLIGLNVEFEFVVVDDGSPDEALTITKDLVANEDTEYCIVELARNFGHHPAMMAGLEHAQGDRVFLIDCDLEEDPELLVDFQRRMNDEDLDVIYGVQQQRKGNWFEQWSGAVFYWLFNLLSTHEIPPNLCTVRLMSADYVKALVLHKDRSLFLPGLWAITGFKQSKHLIVKHAREASTYTFAHRFAMLVD
ncbi:MAG: glycosyltransferase family 2 protein, partial [Pseudomonadota bacterium]